jgi:uncharacterized protein
MNNKKYIILITFTVLLIFNVVSRIFFNDFQNAWDAYEKQDYKKAREIWLSLAEQGDSKAQFFLGFMQDMGLGVPEDDKKALKWYKIAAKNGEARAHLFIAYMYDFGQGVPEDNKEAFRLYQIAKELGYVKAVRSSMYQMARESMPQALEILINDASNMQKPKAIFSLAEMYEFGLGIPKDLREAIKLYSRLYPYHHARNRIIFLAKQGHPEALKILTINADKGQLDSSLALAKMYKFGVGVEKDLVKAVKYYNLAKLKENVLYIYNQAKKSNPEAVKILKNDAENGSKKAQETLMWMYKFGVGVSQDKQELLRWFRIIAEKELAKVSKNLINMKGVNVSETLKVITNNAKNGDLEAQLNLGVMSQLGILFPKDSKKAAKWYRLVIDKYKENESMLEANKHSIRITSPGLVQFRDFRVNIPLLMGLVYANGEEALQDEEEAMKWYSLAEDANAMKGFVYELARENIAEALKILIIDAENGNINAQRNLGEMLEFGLVVPKDIKKAVKWYRLAAEQGDTKAQTILGLMYANGQGVFPDEGESLKWLRLAEKQRRALGKTRVYKLALKNVSSALNILTDDAESGIAEAQYYLGRKHTQGFGGSPNYLLGYMWYNLSELRGYDGAAEKISLLEKKMSSQQIEQAQEMIKKWKPRDNASKSIKMLAPVLAQSKKDLTENR